MQAPYRYYRETKPPLNHRQKVVGTSAEACTAVVKTSKAGTAVVKLTEDGTAEVMPCDATSTAGSKLPNTICGLRYGWERTVWWFANFRTVTIRRCPWQQSVF